MILGGYIVGRIADQAIASIGGSLVPWPDPSGGLAVGKRVQLLLVPGSAYQARVGTARGTSRYVALDGPTRIILRIPRVGEVPARLDLQLRVMPARVSARSSDSFLAAPSIDRDNQYVLPPDLRRLLQIPQQSGPIPQ